MSDTRTGRTRDPKSPVGRGNYILDVSVSVKVVLEVLTKGEKWERSRSRSA
jgi:hypothetical protein